jgi:hypothetical protein
VIPNPSARALPPVAIAGSDCCPGRNKARNSYKYDSRPAQPCHSLLQDFHIITNALNYAFKSCIADFVILYFRQISRAALSLEGPLARARRRAGTPDQLRSPVSTHASDASSRLAFASDRPGHSRRAGLWPCGVEPRALGVALIGRGHRSARLRPDRDAASGVAGARDSRQVVTRRVRRVSDVLDRPHAVAGLPALDQ